MPVTDDLELPIERPERLEIVLRKDHDRIVADLRGEIERLTAALALIASRKPTIDVLPLHEAFTTLREICDLAALASAGHEQNVGQKQEG